MNRCHDHRVAEAIGVAHQLIPKSMSRFLHCDYAVGVDPLFSGVHEYTALQHFPEKSYSQVSHLVLPWNFRKETPASQRIPTVVLPGPVWDTYHPPWGVVRSVVHELGHLIDFRTRYDLEGIYPVSEYANIDRGEAFAEAFASWVWGEEVVDQEKQFFEGLTQVGWGIGH